MLDIGYALSTIYDLVGLLPGTFSSAVHGRVFGSYVEEKRELNS